MGRHGPSRQRQNHRGGLAPERTIRLRRLLPVPPQIPVLFFPVLHAATIATTTATTTATTPPTPGPQNIHPIHHPQRPRRIPILPRSIQRQGQIHRESTPPRGGEAIEIRRRCHVEGMEVPRVRRPGPVAVGGLSSGDEKRLFVWGAEGWQRRERGAFGGERGWEVEEHSVGCGEADLGGGKCRGGVSVGMLRQGNDGGGTEERQVGTKR
mmetsp:Transcript_24188/g.50890  ORF Transcript_24188/g.50890 Transcript_24188/m.50890 type:complete len:210 (+) Transcript_24188:532-1161(+)